MSTSEEEKFHQEIRDVYNSGDCGKAVEMSIEFLERFPKSYLARYSYAVMHGDYSYAAIHGEKEKQRLLAIAKKGISEMFNDPDRFQWPQRFQERVRNEYYWFFELHDEQYKLGLEVLKRGENGNYSACVGASMMALKVLKEGKKALAQEWAEKSLHHFAEFEKIAPHWYNINIFSARALASLGKYDEALVSFKDMFRKQKSPENQGEIQKFLNQMDDIRKLRGD